MTQRRPRQLEPQYLAWLRKQPCSCGCNRPAPSDAAHVKSASLKHDKPFSGSIKPDDRWCVPLNRSCHIHQHRYNELLWWKMSGGKDPFALCIRYYAQYHRENPNAPEPHARACRKIKPRKPRAQRQKIKGRSTFAAGRKIPSRKFR